MARTFPRTVAPRRATYPGQPPPMQDKAQTTRVQTRPSLARGFGWTETWGMLDTRSSSAVKQFMQAIREILRSGEIIDIVPWVNQAADGTIPVGTTGQMDGGGQTGSSILTHNWAADGTLVAGDYLTIGGVPNAVGISAGMTIAGGAGTITIDPGVLLGHSPVNNALITLNGPMQCYIVNKPRWPQAELVQVYGGLQLQFREALIP